MSIERIGMEKALPMFLLGAGCIFVTAIVFGILCGNMIRARRKIDRIQRKNEEKYPVYNITSQSQHSIKFPTHITNNKMNNTNQSAAILLPTTKLIEHQSSSRIAIALDPTFKIHPHHPFSIKRIIEL